MNLTEQIPGLSAAVEQEQLVRNVAFLPIKERVCGFDVDPLTLRHVLTLEAIGSPFVCGGFLEPQDFAAFFVVITGVKGWARRRLLKKLGKFTFEEAATGIKDFISEAVQDSPASSGGIQGASYYSNGAAVVDAMAHEYGWPEEEILDLPLKRCFQYLKAIAARNGHRVLFNPSDKVRGQWLSECNRN